MKGSILKPICLSIVVFVLILSGRHAAIGGENEEGSVFLPFFARPLEAPMLLPVENSDWDNHYNILWNSGSAAYYVLQEATNPDFTGANIVYEGYSSQWAVPDSGRLPGTYYYRVRSHVGNNYSDWSNVQAITVNPIYVGLDLRWDGVGYLNIGNYYQVGSHFSKTFDTITSPGVVRARNRDWYDPDPLQFGETSWDEFYEVSTGRFLSSSVPGNPSWKWGPPWLAGYNADFSGVQTVMIDGQRFTVTGPHDGHTAFGYPVRYWEFTNQERFLIYDDGGDWTQYVHPGDILLRYDAGASKLMIHSNELRHYYENGDRSDFTVQYIMNLTQAGSFPGGNTVTRIEGEDISSIIEQPVGFDLSGLRWSPASP